MSKRNAPQALFEGSHPAILIAVLLLFVASCFYFSAEDSSAHTKHMAQHVEAIVQDSEAALEAELRHLSSLNRDSLFQHFDKHSNRYDAKGLSFFAFDQGELSAWSTNRIPQTKELPSLLRSGSCLLLPNGWYLIKDVQVDQRQMIGLFLIKYEYLYQNKHLNNRFHPCFNIEDGAEISTAQCDDCFAVHNSAGEEIFQVTVQASDRPEPLRLALLVISLLLLLYVGIKFLFNALYQRSGRLGILAIGLTAVLGLRLLTLKLGVPASLRALSVFDPAIFARSFLYPSLADLLINAFILLLLSYVGKTWVKRRESRIHTSLIALLSGGFFYSARRLDRLFYSLIRDSKIQFNISNFFDLDIHSLAGVVAICMLGIAMLHFAQTLVYFIREKQWSDMRFGLIALLVLTLLILINHLYGVTDMIKVLWSYVLLAFILLADRWKSRSTRLVYLLVSIGILAFYAAHVFEKQVVNKDRDELQVIADRLMEGEDPVVDYLYEEIRLDIAGDEQLWGYVKAPELDEERMLSYVRSQYFQGYWTKYYMDLQVLEEGVPFNGVLPTLPSDSAELGFYHLADAELGLNYVLRFDPDSLDREVFLRFQLDLIPEELGFPELLIQGNSLRGEQLSRYSLAHYHMGALVDQYGDYDYAREEPQWQGDTKYYMENAYWHFPFTRATDAYIISSPRKSFMNRLTTFTYLFSLFGIMIFIAYAVERILLEQRAPVLDLQNKVQFLVVGVLFLALSVFGISAYYYILSQNKANNEGLLSEKVSSVLIELSHKLEKEQAMGDQEKLELYLKKFSKVFFTDINLYGLDGDLMASSRPLVFSRGLLSERMHTKAYQELAIDQESRYIHDELIGEMEYLSAYVPFVNSKKEVLAYLNLPYFAKQSELEDELSRFLVTVVNILVLLFVLSLLVALLVSNWITRPLQLLKENLATMRLDRRNEPITYQGSDEIASLVNAYNTKVSELQSNAELLAKSERESAWREMAKQVAHEIKNPLTPMKLSIQYLQKSKAEDSEDWEERFTRSTDMLIEQIDSLSNIATAFSDFAKMPKAISEHFKVGELVAQVADLFSEEPSAEIELSLAVDEEAELFADRDQIGRMLTNLIKNAVQSIPSERQGKVIVSLIDKGGQYILEVMDNGTGIPEEMKEKIFVPNFTTKTTGTGLGLAMCQNIVEQAKGKIWFTTELDKGTSFYVSLPKPSEA